MSILKNPVFSVWPGHPGDAARGDQLRGGDAGWLLHDPGRHGVRHHARRHQDRLRESFPDQHEELSSRQDAAQEHALHPRLVLLQSYHIQIQINWINLLLISISSSQVSQRVLVRRMTLPTVKMARRVLLPPTRLTMTSSLWISRISPSGFWFTDATSFIFSDLYF